MPRKKKGENKDSQKTVDFKDVNELYEKFQNYKYFNVILSILENILNKPDHKISKGDTVNIIKKFKIEGNEVENVYNNIKNLLVSLGLVNVVKGGRGGKLELNESNYKIVETIVERWKIEYKLIEDFKKFVKEYNKQTQEAFYSLLNLMKRHAKDGMPLNELTKKLLESLGFKDVVIVDKRGDEGIDIIATWLDEFDKEIVYGIQSKYWASQESISKSIFTEIISKFINYTNLSIEKKKELDPLKRIVDRFLIITFSKNPEKTRQNFNEAIKKYGIDIQKRVALLDKKSFYDLFLKKSIENPEDFPIIRVPIPISEKEQEYIDILIPEKVEKMLEISSEAIEE